MLDVGTGSGAIALALADELPGGRDHRHRHLARRARGRRRRTATGWAAVERVRLAYGSLEPGRVRPRGRQPALRERGGVGRAGAGDPRATSRARRWSPGRPGSRRSRACSAIWRSPSGRRGDRRSRSAPARRATVAELVRRAGFERVESAPRPRRDRAGGGRVDVSEARGRSSAACSAAGSRLFPADGLYGLACDPTRAEAIERIHRIKGRDDGKPVGGHVLLAPGDARDRRRARPAHPRRARRPAPGPGDAGGREPRAPLPARLPRGSRAARPAADRGAARRARPCADLPDLRQPRRASRRRRASPTSIRRSSPPSTWRSTAASSRACRRRSST